MPSCRRNSILGQFMKALFGYNPTPSLTEMLAYAAYVGTVWFALRSGQSKAAEAVQAG